MKRWILGMLLAGGCGLVNWTYPNQYVVDIQVPMVDVNSETNLSYARNFLIPTQHPEAWPSHLVGECVQHSPNLPGLDQTRAYPLAYSVLEVDDSEIRFGGEQVVFFPRPWTVPDTELGPPLLIQPLLAALQQMEERVRRAEEMGVRCWRPFPQGTNHTLHTTLLVAIDKDTPGHLFRQVLYTIRAFGAPDPEFLIQDSEFGSPVRTEPEDHFRMDPEDAFFTFRERWPHYPPSLHIEEREAEFGVELRPDGYRLYGSTASGWEVQSLNCAQTPCGTVDNYPLEALKQQLLRRSEGVPNLRQIHVIADSQVTYGAVLKTANALQSLQGPIPWSKQDTLLTQQLFGWVGFGLEVPKKPAPPEAEPLGALSKLEGQLPETGFGRLGLGRKKSPPATVMEVHLEDAARPEIENGLKKAASYFRYCYYAHRPIPNVVPWGRAPEPIPPAEWTGVFQIDASERPSQIWVSQSTMTDRETSACIKEALMDVRFDGVKPSKQRIKVTLSFEMNPDYLNSLSPPLGESDTTKRSR